jgi:hypothetical protein
MAKATAPPIIACIVGNFTPMLLLARGFADGTLMKVVEDLEPQSAPRVVLAFAFDELVSLRETVEFVPGIVALGTEEIMVELGVDASPVVIIK